MTLRLPSWRQYSTAADEAWRPLTDEVSGDRLGSLWAIKHGVAPMYPQAFPPVVDPATVPGAP